MISLPVFPPPAGSAGWRVKAFKSAGELTASNNRAMLVASFPFPLPALVVLGPSIILP